MNLNYRKKINPQQLYKLQQYNRKDFFAHKINDDDICDYKDTLYKLGLDLSKNRKQGHVNVILQRDETIEISWLSDHKQDIENGRFFYKNGKWKDISAHKVCGSHLKGTISNRKLKKFSLIDDEELSKKFYKLEKIHGVNPHKKSHVLVIDFDCHNNQYTKQQSESHLYTILEYFNLPEVQFFERSHNYGFHLYLQFDNIISDEDKYIIEQKFLEYNINIECIRSNQLIRLPLSVNYKPYNLEYDKNYNLIFNEIENFTEFNKIIDSKQKSIKLSEYVDINKPIKKIKENKSIYENTYNRNSKQIQEDDLYYGKGYRVHKWYTEGLVFHFYKLANFNKQQFSNLLHHYNIDSKDMLKNPDLCIDQAFNYCEDKYKSIYPVQENNSFISNSKYVESNKTEKLFRTLATFVYHDQELKNKYEKNKLNNITSIQQMLQEIFGRICFEKEKGYQRKIKKSAQLRKETKSSYEECITFFIKDSGILNEVKNKRISLSFLEQNFILTKQGNPCSIPGKNSCQRYSLSDKISNNSIDTILFKLITKINNIYKRSISKFKSIYLKNNNYIYSMLFSFENIYNIFNGTNEINYYNFDYL